MSNETLSSAMMPPNRTVTSRTLRMDTWLSAQGFGLPPSAQSICEGRGFVKRSGRSLVGSSRARGKPHRVGHDAIDDQRGSNDTRTRDPAVVARSDAGKYLDTGQTLRARLVGASFGTTPERIEDIARQHARPRRREEPLRAAGATADRPAGAHAAARS